MRRVDSIALAALALGSMSFASQPALAPQTEVVNETQRKRMKRAVASGSLRQWRSKGKPHRRKVRKNMNHISRRVRRKHRRAA